MPYLAGKNLPAERASKLGHLEVIKSPLVQRLIQNFEEPNSVEIDSSIAWQPFSSLEEPLDLVFAVDGSLQTIEDERPPHKALAFVKTALIKMDQVALGRIDSETPHPFILRDLMSETALYHATAFPLRHIYTSGISIYHAVRQIIYESIKDDLLGGEIMETLKWLAYETWSSTPRSLPEFQCPHCNSSRATLPINAEKGPCPDCRKEIFITDMLGFHLEMVEDAARDSVATAYMNLHETLLLFTGVRHFWQTDRNVLKRCLFLKDGPLQIRAQYSKLVNPIRNFLLHACSLGYPVSIVGQEKTGTFVEHLNLISRNVLSTSLFVPSHNYICEKIQHRPADGAPYGKDTNYGAKVFVVVNERSRFVLNIPVSIPMAHFVMNPEICHLINIKRILATVPTLLSSRHENALLPIELANSIASLSTYPSAQVLKLFTNARIKRV